MSSEDRKGGVRPGLESRTAVVSRAVRAALPPEEGFVLLTFEYAGGQVAYASTANQVDTLKLLEGMCDLLRVRQGGGEA